jgi:hypothetical protein
MESSFVRRQPVPAKAACESFTGGFFLNPFYYSEAKISHFRVLFKRAGR